MNFQLHFEIPKSTIELVHGDKIALIGSCFSDSMSSHFVKAGFEVSANPFGTIFHPTALASCLQSVLNDSDKVDVLQRDDLFFSWDSSETLYAKSESELIDRILTKRKAFKNYLSSAKLIVITFGTAWGYKHHQLDKIVGNCHKMPASDFSKHLMEVEAETNKWQYIVKRLKGLNPDLEVVFTVSPVRHKKDGLVENNRSKSRLIELVHSTLQEAIASYFPSYEIVMDELRDYRFFTKDRVHPTTEAVSYVWKRFEETHFSNETRELAEKVRRMHQTIDHKSLHPDSADSKRYMASSKEKLEQFKAEYPKVYWP